MTQRGFLAGFVLARFRVIRRVAWERIAAAGLALAAALILRRADAIVTLGVVVAVLAVSVAVETARLREIRAEVRAA